ncbi:MAG: pilin [Methylophilaceae bacterium]
MFCSKCGAENADSATSCSQCNYLLNQMSSPAKAELTQEEQYQAIIGDKNQAYYLKHFAQFDANGKTNATWHWPALFVPFYWFLYRKMWPYAILYFIIPYIGMLVIGILATIVGESANLLISIFYFAFFIALLVLPALFANALYYKHCKKEIASVIAKKLNTERTVGELVGNGGTSGAALIAVLVIVFVAVIGILAAIAIPAYQDYVNRAKTTQALYLGKQVSLAVTDYYAQHNVAPANLAEAGFNGTAAADPALITLNPKSGVISMTMSNAVLKGKSLQLVPALNDANEISWTCMSEDIKDSLLPIECRQPPKK